MPRRKFKAFYLVNYSHFNVEYQLIENKIHFLNIYTQMLILFFPIKLSNKAFNSGSPG